MKAMALTAVMTLVVAIPLLLGGRVLLQARVGGNSDHATEEDERYSIDELMT